MIGKKCRYDGKDMTRDFAVELAAKQEVVAVCPEELGGLLTPRPPAEIINGEVKNINNQSVTEFYKFGAQKALEQIQGCAIEKAYLKSKSPMCGCGKIYDGSFSGRLIDGDGVFVKHLKEKYPNLIIEAVD